MKRLCLFVLFCGLSAANAADKPRLAAVIVVDQMRADYLDRFSAEWKHGFKRLQGEAAVFSEARFAHVPTETGPGHAAILTGLRPDRHGIVANDWYDRASGSMTYCAADSVHGLGPEHLLAYTLGDALKARDPRSKTASLSGKDRSAIFLGGKRPDLALWYDRGTGEFTTSTYYKSPQWLSAFNARLKRKGGPLHGRDKKGLKHFVREPGVDAVLLDLVLKAADDLKLGRDEHPDILAVSFSATDYVGHDHGTEGPEMREQLLSLDLLLGRLLAELEKRAGKGRVLVALTADHGAPRTPEDPSQREAGAVRLSLEELSASLEKALQYHFPAKEPWIVESYPPHVYLNMTQAGRLQPDRRAFLRQAAAALETAPRVARAYVPGEIPEDDPFAAVYGASVYPGRSGDLIVRVKPGVMVSWDPEGVDHGSPYDDDARVPLLFWGPAFRASRVDGKVAVADLSATLAHVLGIEFKTEGKVRTEALSLP